MDNPNEVPCGDDGMREEYDFSTGERNRYAGRLSAEKLRQMGEQAWARENYEVAFQYWAEAEEIERRSCG